MRAVQVASGAVRSTHSDRRTRAELPANSQLRRQTPAYFVCDEVVNHLLCLAQTAGIFEPKHGDFRHRLKPNQR